MRLRGKRALVTGGASGIGRATAIRLAAEGASVAIADINAEGLAETADMMPAPPADQIVFDAAAVTSCQDLVSRAATDGLDILCNIAGILKWGPSIDFPIEDFERVLRINTTSVFVLCQAALPALLKSRGTIINMASTAALQGIAYTVAYAASKHAVAAITKSLAIEFAAAGVRINAICPGQVATAMGTGGPPSGDLDWGLVMRNAPKLKDGISDPADVAAMFAFLASDDARKVTGALFTIAGGQLAG